MTGNIVINLIAGSGTEKDLLLPVFLFSGQSNMVGRPQDAGNTYHKANPGDEGHTLNTLLPILTDSSTTNEQKQALLQAQIEKVPNSDADSARASFMATQLLDMSSRYSSLWNEISYPMGRVYCSFTNPSKTQVLDAGAEISPSAGCGNPWSLELTFSHAMARTKSEMNDFAIIKVAAGGTELRRDWSSPSGNHWDVLQNRIQTPLDSSVHVACGTNSTKTCRWAGFVWFQGENDCFAESNAKTYYDDLKDFIREVRMQLHTATPLYATPDEIPVIIVKLGYFASRRPFGSTVIESQIRYASETNHTYTIETVDLGKYYHYDAASLLIMGDRLAHQLATIIKTPTPTPLPPPSPYPSKKGILGLSVVISSIFQFLTSNFS